MFPPPRSCARAAVGAADRERHWADDDPAAAAVDRVGGGDRRRAPALGRGPRQAGLKVGFAAMTDSSPRDFPPENGFLRGRPGRGSPCAAALFRRPRHERDVEVDPGRVFRRGRLPDGQPRPAGRGLRGDRRQGPASRRAGVHVLDARGSSARVPPTHDPRRRGPTATTRVPRASAPVDRQARGRRARRPAATRRPRLTGEGNDRCGSRPRSRRWPPS